MKQKIHKDSHFKSIIKAISWRVVATITTMVISYFITKNIKFAISIGGIEVVAKIILYYIHERFWQRVLHIKSGADG